MRSLLEKDIEKKVCDWAKKNGILPIKFTPMGEAGWPDRIFIRNGKAVFIEFKAPGKHTRPLQDARIRALQLQKMSVGVYDNVDHAIEFLATTLLSS